MPKQTEIVAIVSGTLMVAGAVALTLANKATPPELWVLGSAAIAGGLGIAVPSSSAATSAATDAANLFTAAAGELSKIAGYLTAKAVPTTGTQPQPTPAAAAAFDGPAPAVPPESPSTTGAPAPATPITTPAARTAVSI